MRENSANIFQNNMRDMWSKDFLFEQYPDAILIVNEGGKIEDANRKLLEMLGYDKSEIIGKTMEILMPKRFRASHVGIRKEHMANHSSRSIETGMKFEAQRKDGSCFDIDIMLAPMETENGNITVCVIRDITEKKAAHAREVKAKEELKAVVDTAPVAIFGLNKDKIVTSWSNEAEKLFGYKPEEVIGKPYKLIPENEMNSEHECTSLLAKVFAGNAIHDKQRKRLHKDGSLIDISISAAPMFDENGDIYGATYCAQDISERIKAEEKLTELAFFDPLTKLANLAHWQKDFAEMKPVNMDNIVAFAGIELNGISEINNILGHTSGGKIIKEVAKRFKKVIPNNATLYKTGGIKFGLAVPISKKSSEFIDIIEMLFEQIHLPFIIDEKEIYITANVGISIAPIHGSSSKDILANTGLALHTAKKDNTRNFCLFTQSLKEQAKAKRNLDIELRDALKNNEFEIFYQPQIRLCNGELVGAEALLRWRHPTRGLVQPNYFIDALANNPISYKVGKWIMKTAAKQAMEWRKNGFPNFRIGVNLFETQFDPKIIEDDIEAILEETGLPHDALELEITENISHGSDDEIIKPLNNLKEKGVHIAFDDFGTGYASLSYLVKYPLTRIKIDKSFLENIPYSKEDSAIVHSTIIMAHALGLEVIAEGVETHEHVLFLNGQKCEEAQGFYYAKPMNAEKFFEYANNIDAENTQICSAIA